MNGNKPEVANNINFSAYMAGVLDSDGSLSICLRHKKRKNSNYTAMFQLSWTSTELAKSVMEEIKFIYGGNICKAMPSGQKLYPNTRLTLRYSLTGDGLVKFLTELLPYIKLKRKQAINILRLRKFTNYYGTGRSKPKKVKDFEYKLYILNKHLNTKNGTYKCI